MAKATPHKAWTYYNPVRITTGSGAFERLRHLVPPEGLIMLVTTAGFTQRGMTARVKQQLGGARVVTYDDVTPNPELDGLDQATSRFREQPVRCIVGLGGGSVLDAAKVLAVTLCCDLSDPLDRVFRQGQDLNWKARLPVTAIPTTSGTGAEVTPFATVWDSTTHKKHSLTGEHIYPTHALLDPELTLTLPRKETLYPALDTISHALESLWNKNRTPLSEAYATQALILANKALPIILEAPDNLEQRSRMQQASMLAGLAISQTRTAIAHSISYPLTSRFGVPHGLACSFTLPWLIEEWLPRVSESYLGDLLKTTGALLERGRLSDEIAYYVDESQALSCVDEMIIPERAGNYPRTVGPGEIRTAFKVIFKRRRS